eukprot:828702-Prorocentrum_minimum.AAC.3
MVANGCTGAWAGGRGGAFPTVTASGSQHRFEVGSNLHRLVPSNHHLHLGVGVPTKDICIPDPPRGKFTLTPWHVACVDLALRATHTYVWGLT